MFDLFYARKYTNYSTSHHLSKGFFTQTETLSLENLLTRARFANLAMPTNRYLFVGDNSLPISNKGYCAKAICGKWGKQLCAIEQPPSAPVPPPLPGNPVCPIRQEALRKVRTGLFSTKARHELSQ